MTKTAQISNDQMIFSVQELNGKMESFYQKEESIGES